MSDNNNASEYWADNFALCRAAPDAWRALSICRAREVQDKGAVGESRRKLRPSLDLFSPEAEALLPETVEILIQWAPPVSEREAHPNRTSAQFWMSLREFLGAGVELEDTLADLESGRAPDEADDTASVPGDKDEFYDGLSYERALTLLRAYRDKQLSVFPAGGAAETRAVAPSSATESAAVVGEELSEADLQKHEDQRQYMIWELKQRQLMRQEKMEVLREELLRRSYGKESGGGRRRNEIIDRLLIFRSREYNATMAALAEREAMFRSWASHTKLTTKIAEVPQFTRSTHLAALPGGIQDGGTETDAVVVVAAGRHFSIYHVTDYADTEAASSKLFSDEGVHQREISCLALTRDSSGSLVVLIGTHVDRHVYAWNISSENPVLRQRVVLQTFMASEGISALAVAQDGSGSLVVGLQSGVVVEVELNFDPSVMGDLRRTLAKNPHHLPQAYINLGPAAVGASICRVDRGAARGIVSVAFSPDNEEYAVAASHGAVIGMRVFGELDSPTQHIFGHSKITRVSFSPDAAFLYGATDGGVHIWDLEALDFNSGLLGETEVIGTSLLYSADRVERGPCPVPAVCASTNGRIFVATGGEISVFRVGLHDQVGYRIRQDAYEQISDYNLLGVVEDMLVLPCDGEDDIVISARSRGHVSVLRTSEVATKAARAK